MSRRLVIITEIISPYRIPLFNALASRPDIDLHVIFLAETDPGLRQWHVYKDEIRFSYQVLPSRRMGIGPYKLLLNRGIKRALSATNAAVILCGGYNYVASWQALGWARTRRVPFVLWSESNEQDARSRRPVVEFLKAKFIRRCSAFVVPGQSAFTYLRNLGVETTAIFTARNAVDNDLFATAAADARLHGTQVRSARGLPERYFLFVGRLVEEKGVFEFLAAYESLPPETRQKIGLLFVGDGRERASLEQEAASITPGRIQFVGFAQREELAKYYALADALILPTHSDPWGLVVNEAMACGLPVIVSEVAGCASDLVTDGWNGRTIPYRDVPSLAHALQDLATDSQMRDKMARNSEKRIAEYSPVAWAEGIGKMMNSVGSLHE